MGKVLKVREIGDPILNKISEEINIQNIDKIINNNGFATKENIEKYSLRDKEYNENKYKVITLCGSTKFKDEFIKVQRELTLDGNIVISLSLFGHSGDSEVWEGMDEGTLTKTKRMLDEMHRRKIDMSDEIFVINVGGYIGDSTKSEIEYAKRKGKIVKYLEES